MKAWISDLEPRDLVLRTHIKGWDEAFKVAEIVRDLPPLGYRLTVLKIAKDACSSGRRLSLTITLRHMDRREALISATKGRSYLLAVLEAIAGGLDSIAAS